MLPPTEASSGAGGASVTTRSDAACDTLRALHDTITRLHKQEARRVAGLSYELSFRLSSHCDASVGSHVANLLAMNRIARLLGSIGFKLRQQVSALARLPRDLA